MNSSKPISPPITGTRPGKDFVVDTNVLFSALIADGRTREIIVTEDTGLFGPEFFFTVVSNNRPGIQQKSGLSRSDIDVLLNLLFEQITIVPRVEFNHELTKADDLIGNVDPDDIPFLALALYRDCAVWSDDRHFR